MDSRSQLRQLRQVIQLLINNIISSITNNTMELVVDLILLEEMLQHPLELKVMANNDEAQRNNNNNYYNNSNLVVGLSLILLKTTNEIDWLYVLVS